MDTDENDDIRTRATRLLSELDQAGAHANETLDYLHEVREVTIDLLGSIQDCIRTCNESKANAAVYTARVSEILADY